MEINPSEILSQARTAFRNKEYEIAFEKYQWFFHNSIKIDESYIGVRLSYCLDEWTQLGNQYQPAMTALLELEKDSLNNFHKTHNRRAFHEYASIAEYLEHQEEVFNQFLALHKSKANLTNDLFTFVYEYCANNQMWELCFEYLGNAQNQYNQAVEMFDHITEFAKERGDEGESLFKDALENIEKEMLWILNMLYSVNALDDYRSTLYKIEADLKTRGHETLFTEISRKLPNTLKSL